MKEVRLDDSGYLYAFARGEYRNIYCPLTNHRGVRIKCGDWCAWYSERATGVSGVAVFCRGDVVGELTGYMDKE
jgi:hypothetical protein